MQHFRFEEFIRESLKEDLQQGDITSEACIPEHHYSRAILKVKEEGVIAGVELAREIFHFLDPEMEMSIYIQDGSFIHFGEIAFEIYGRTRHLLAAERLVLNIMQHMSGIATLSNRFATEVADLPVCLLDTRKTIPLNRYIEKWAVRIGGCQNYRYGLYDRFMIKDNHIAACGSIAKAIKMVNQYRKKKSLKECEITIEVKNLIEIEEVLRYGRINRIMMDNFELALLAEGVAIIDKKYETEASGGVSLQNVRKIALTGVDFISIGALTHSAGSLDLSLKIQS